VGDEAFRLGQGAREEFVGGRRQRVARGRFLRAQGLAEAAQIGGVDAG